MLTFKLHSITRYLYLYYLIIKEYKFHQVKLKKEKTQKLRLLNKTVKAIMKE